MTIQDEIRQALIEAGNDVGGEPLMVGFVAVVEDKPWDVQPNDSPVMLPCLDSGIKEMLVEGSSEKIAMRRLLVPYDELYQPKVGDAVVLKSKRHTVHKIEPVSPFTNNLMYKVYLAL